MGSRARAPAFQDLLQYIVQLQEAGPLSIRTLMGGGGGGGSHISKGPVKT